MSFLLCLVFFLSGAAALLFETLWFHRAGLALGNSIWASSLVLAGFMGGLALGNGLAARFGHRVGRPVRLYAAIELVIGASGLALVYLLPAITPALAALLRPVVDDPWIANPLRFVIAFPLLLVPSTAMGATLPLLVAALFRRDPHFGRVLGRLYGWNTLGAVAGALAGEGALIGWLGIGGTAWLAALLNVSAALLALAGGRRLDAERPDDSVATPVAALPARAHGLLAGAFLAGGMLLALEVVWFRFLQLFVHGTSLAFAAMLAVVLAGIGCGGLVGAWWLSRRPEAQRNASALALATGVVCGLVYVGFAWVPRPPSSGSALETLRLALPLMFPVSLLSGILFTLIGAALDRQAPAQTRSAGLLTLANTTGAMLGSLIGGFLLLPRLGIEASIQVLAASYGLAALACLLAVRPARGVPSRVLAAGAGALVLVLVLFPRGLMERSFLSAPLDRFAVSDYVPVEIREGLTETILYLRRESFGEARSYRLLTNGHSMASTAIPARRYMKLYVYLPVAVHPDPRSALLISYGVGNTAKALVDTASFETIDVVDVSRDILDLSRIVYPDPAEHPLRDPRVSVHVEDGRHFLQTTDRRFDLITGEPPPPKIAGVVNLFSREYFELARGALAEGGILTYWLPMHLLREPEAEAIIRGFCEAFEDCSLWTGSGLDWMLVGTRGASGPVSAEHFARQWHDPRVGPELRAVGLERPEQLGALFLAGPEDLRERVREVPPLDDDHPKRVSPEAPGTRDHLTDLYAPWMDVTEARRRFADSRLVARLWPPVLREETLDYFELQDTLNRPLLGRLRGPASELGTLHEVLTGSDLTTLPLWMLQSDADAQRAARSALAKGWRDAPLAYQLGAGALAGREYARAASHFAEAQALGPTPRMVLYYRIYALCMSGQLDAARSLARRLVAGADAPVAALLWQTFGVDSPARGRVRASRSGALTPRRTDSPPRR